MSSPPPLSMSPLSTFAPAAQPTQWKCDVFNTIFDTYDEAVEYERQCLFHKVTAGGELKSGGGLRGDKSPSVSVGAMSSTTVNSNVTIDATEKLPQIPLLQMPRLLPPQHFQ